MYANLKAKHENNNNVIAATYVYWKIWSIMECKELCKLSNIKKKYEIIVNKVG